MRVEFLGLQKLFDSIAEGKADLRTYRDFVHNNVHEIDALLRQIHFDTYPDAIQEINNNWQLMKASPLLSWEPDARHPSADKLPSAQEILSQIKLLDELVRRVVFLSAYITIPQRLRDWLDKTKPGYSIPFDSVFEDEVPDQADRKKILSFLAYSPEVLSDLREPGKSPPTPGTKGQLSSLGGLVDMSSGVIYKYSTKLTDQLGSLLWIIFALAGSVLFIWGMSNGFGLIGTAQGAGGITWPYAAKDFGPLLIAWGSILVGVVVHLGVSAAKRAQTEGQPSVFVTAGLLERVSVQWGTVVYKLFLALLALFFLAGFFGMSTANPLTSMTPYTAFLTGYSLDSIIGLVGTTLDREAAARAEALQKPGTKASTA